jgi:hypothetical protein
VRRGGQHADVVASRAAGIGTEFVLAIDAFALEPMDGATASALSSDGLLRYCNIVFCRLFAGVSLPSGAVVTGFEVDAFDNDATIQLVAELDVYHRGGGGTFVGVLSTGIEDAPGRLPIRRLSLCVAPVDQVDPGPGATFRREVFGPRLSEARPRRGRGRPRPRQRHRRALRRPTASGSAFGSLGGAPRRFLLLLEVFRKPVGEVVLVDVADILDRLPADHPRGHVLHVTEPDVGI